MDRCNATRDLSPCTNCNGPECSERIKQPKTNRKWLDGMSNEDLIRSVQCKCPPGRLEDGKDCKQFKTCVNCWVDWLNQPAESEE